ncbi:dnaJ homolog subfamily C member 13-like, partial [Ostrinia furnacalis]|uniref:dnaJ homolog subfamily C member 13-like n=1 Tax=Ostrinia furnacalis TaxID=93504 RepID=UPI00103F7AE9
QANLRSPKKFLQELLTETLNALSKDTTEVGGNNNSLFNPKPSRKANIVWNLCTTVQPENLRSPKKFLQELLTETLNALSKDTTEGSRGAVCAAALAALVRARPHLGGACASYGELPRLARLLPACPEHAVPVLHALVQAQACVVALSSTDVMAGLKAAMKACPEVVGVACEALATIFNSSCNTDRLVNQAIETDLITELLSLLETRLDGQTAAQLVSALKAMARCPAHAERVRALLARSRVWEQYSQQRHDLFIAATPQHHSIAGAPHTAGYLTAPPASIPAQPPPID